MAREKLGNTKKNKKQKKTDLLSYVNSFLRVSSSEAMLIAIPVSIYLFNDISTFGSYLMAVILLKP